MTMVLIFLLDTHSPDKVSYFFELFEGNTFTASENWRSFALSVRTKPSCVVALVRFMITHILVPPLPASSEQWYKWKGVA